MIKKHTNVRCEQTPVRLQLVGLMWVWMGLRPSRRMMVVGEQSRVSTRNGYIAPACGATVPLAGLNQSITALLSRSLSRGLPDHDDDYTQEI
jgi:hypothetical protein